MDWLAVEVDFDRSHLLFPTLVALLLAALGLAILVTRRRAIAAAVAGPRAGGADHLRLWGTLALCVAYILALPPVGRLAPNTGAGFLICSPPFILALSLLYMHPPRGGRALLAAAATAVAAPLVVWGALARAFNISLP